MVVTCMCVLPRGRPRLRPAGGRVRVRPGRGAWLPPDPLKISFSWTAARDREEFAGRSPESSSNHERTTDITDFRGRVSVPGRVCPRKPRLTLPRGRGRDRSFCDTMTHVMSELVEEGRPMSRT